MVLLTKIYLNKFKIIIYILRDWDGNGELDWAIPSINIV
jgi:hypothetical protein